MKKDNMMSLMIYNSIITDTRNIGIDKMAPNNLKNSVFKIA